MIAWPLVFYPLTQRAVLMKKNKHKQFFNYL